ncbi:MAG: BREX system P-loop protein BrxC [Leptospiraceae bacterium]|nr:BREX system P-loop protein BrxC [Leptospiraceae bacterium]
MLNREIYSIDPTDRKLLNDGVSNVNDGTEDSYLEVLRYELETFVCEGQYEKGLELILETFLKNLNQASQPAVWVSGFFGSGKSHLIKMLRALWVDTKFSDGSTSRSIVQLPNSIKDLLKELSTAGSRMGGLHAASGTLGSAARGSVRLAVLRILFKSLGLPGNYHVAKFALWLKKENIYEILKERVQPKNQEEWIYILDMFYSDENLHKTLVDLKPKVFPNQEDCSSLLTKIYPTVTDISNDDFIRAIKESLTTEDGKFPLTLFVFDEVQQYIGEDVQKSIYIQEVVETCSKSFSGKLMFIGTGQTAITGTAFIKKLEGRFTVRVELSDADVDSVIRKVILAKKPNVMKPLEELLFKHQGEISRHLGNTSLSHKPEENAVFPLDYPILPIRRKFWEKSLRNLDATGTDSQLRNQLSMVHRAIKTNLEKPLGSIIPTDYLFFEAAEKMVQSRNLPRKVYEKSVKLKNGNEDEKLLGRAIGVIFLIGKISAKNKDIGLRSSVDTIADLLLDDLNEGSTILRSKLPLILDNAKDIIMRVGDEYRIQTEESTAWNDEFYNQRSLLANEPHRIEDERNDRIKKKFAQQVKLTGIHQGKSKESRDIFPYFESTLPKDHTEKLTIWVRNGWTIDENSVLADARQLDSNSSTILVYIPKRSADDLRHQLIDFKAATATLDKKGSPNSAEGQEAKAAMETTKRNAEAKIDELLLECLSGTRVFQSGGVEIIGDSLQDAIHEGIEKSLLRLFPHFDLCDHVGWGYVYENARKGAADALKAIHYDGEAKNQDVCKRILSFIGSGKSGGDIRSNFKQPPFGWTNDSIDGALFVLLVSNLIRATDENQKNVDFKKLERKTISKTIFKVENNPPSTQQRIQIRQLFSKLGISSKSNEESQKVPEFLESLINLAKRSGGEPPKPEIPNPSILEEIRLSGGNEQLHILYNAREEISHLIEEWKSVSSTIDQRWDEWAILKRLSFCSEGLEDRDEIISQVDTIEKDRLLLQNPNPIPNLIQELTQKLRTQLNHLKDRFELTWNQGEEKLENDSHWKGLSPEQRHQLRLPHGFIESGKPVIDLSSSESILNFLEYTSLNSFENLIMAMPSRYDQMLLEAAQLLEPKARKGNLPQAILKTDEDVDTYVEKVSVYLKEEIKKGPIIIQ